jgi:hypothetical protein
MYKQYSKARVDPRFREDDGWGGINNGDKTVDKVGIVRTLFKRRWFAKMIAL